MNRIIFTAAFFILGFSAQCQITKGTWIAGGNANYNSTKFNSTAYGQPHTLRTLRVEPDFGYFLIDKLAAGIKANIIRVKLKGEPTSSTDFNLGPFARYYLLQSGRKVNIVTGAAYAYGFSRNSGIKVDKSSFTFSAGPAFFLNSSVAFETLMSYSTSKINKFEGSNNSLIISIGFQVHLEKDRL